jgi:hypothetical protein
MEKVARQPHDPPFDGNECPMCPMPMRNLHAVARNLLCRWDDKNRRHKVPEEIEELRRAVEMVQPYADAHFADRSHSHGPEITLPSPATPDAGSWDSLEATLMADPEVRQGYRDATRERVVEAAINMRDAIEARRELRRCDPGAECRQEVNRVYRECEADLFHAVAALGEDTNS